MIGWIFIFFLEFYCCGRSKIRWNLYSKTIEVASNNVLVDVSFVIAAGHCIFDFFLATIFRLIGSQPAEIMKHIRKNLLCIENHLCLPLGFTWQKHFFTIPGDVCQTFFAFKGTFANLFFGGDHALGLNPKHLYEIELAWWFRPTMRISRLLQWW